VLVATWARGLIRSTSSVLLDREMDHPIVAQLHRTFDADPRTELTDLHVWRVGRRAYACALALRTDDRGVTPEALRARLAAYPEIVHSTIEVEHR
ncbi:MAG: cation transporter, partial [Gammaproteobacteria bacterium]|nr:cation transporter [Gammaproteobacteria bacterium]